MQDGVPIASGPDSQAVVNLKQLIGGVRRRFVLWLLVFAKCFNVWILSNEPQFYTRSIILKLDFSKGQNAEFTSMGKCQW